MYQRQGTYLISWWIVAERGESSGESSASVKVLLDVEGVLAIGNH